MTRAFLCLAREFRIRHLDREDAGQSLARVIAGDADLLALRDTAFRCVAVDLPRQAARKPAKCVPPSRCGILLVKHSMVS